MSHKINNSNKKETYRDNIGNMENEIVSAPERYIIKVYIKHFNNLKRILFGDDTSEIKSNDDKKTKQQKE